MKKLLGISLVAMMAVTSANAEIASKAYVDQREAAANTYTDTKIGTLPGNAENVGAAIGSLGEGNDTVAEAIAAAVAGAQANWTETTTTDPSYIQNKPTLGALASKDEVAESDLASALATKINGKADSADLGALAALDEVAEANLASALATKINGKADAATTLAGYGITDGVQSNTAITAANGNNLVSYDAKGLVTGGVAAGTAATATVETTGVASNTTTLPTTAQVKSYVDSAAAASNFVEDSITDAITNKAPSENAVFDALAQKQGLIGSATDNDGQYVLTADLSEGVMTNYRWELVQRSTTGQ